MTIFNGPLLALLVAACQSAAPQQDSARPAPPAGSGAPEAHGWVLARPVTAWQDRDVELSGPRVVVLRHEDGAAYQQVQVQDEHGALLLVRHKDGAVTALVDGEPVPAERVVSAGDRISVRAPDGSVLWELRVLPDNKGLVYPYDANWRELPGGGIAVGDWTDTTDWEQWSDDFVESFTSAWDEAQPQRAPPGSNWNQVFSVDRGESGPRRLIGVTTTSIDEALAAQIGVSPEGGFVIQTVSDDLPAQAAGLQPFDVVVAIDGGMPATTALLREALAGKPQDGKVRLTVLRRGERQELDVGWVERRDDGSSWTFSASADPFSGTEPQRLAEVRLKLAAERDARRAALEANNARLEELRAEMVEQGERLRESGGDPAAREALASSLAALRDQQVLLEAQLRDAADEIRIVGVGTGDGQALVLPPATVWRTRLGGPAGSGAGHAAVEAEAERFGALEERLARLEDLLQELLAREAGGAAAPGDETQGDGSSSGDRP